MPKMTRSSRVAPSGRVKAARLRLRPGNANHTNSVAGGRVRHGSATDRVRGGEHRGWTEGWRTSERAAAAVQDSGWWLGPGRGPEKRLAGRTTLVVFVFVDSIFRGQARMRGCIETSRDI